MGQGNPFRGDKYQWSGQVTARSGMNNAALRNFLLTLSGTQHLTPRALTPPAGLNF